MEVVKIPDGSGGSKDRLRIKLNKVHEYPADVEGTTSPSSRLDVNGSIKASAFYSDTALLGVPGTDGFRIRKDPNFFGANKDALVIEKTDVNEASPDGGISFVNTGSSGTGIAAMTIRGSGNVGIGTTSPSARLSVGSTSQFQVDESGNLAKVNNVAYSWPSAHGGAGTVLTNNGSGSLSWAAPAGSTSIVSKSGNYTITESDSGKFFLVSDAGTTLTLPAASTVSAGFSVTVKVAAGYTIMALTGSDLLDGVNQSKTLSNQTVAQFISDANAWYIGMMYGHLMSGTPVACANDNCYTTTAAMTAGQAATATGKLLTLQNGVWVQFDGNNVLRVDGTDNWQLALSLDGRSYGANNLNKITADLVGRVCPLNVYVDDTNKVATNRCLYFDRGSIDDQTLDRPMYDGVSDQTTAGLIRLGDRASNAGNWYEGNVETCASKGMRLPVLYETTAADPVGTSKPTDASPTFSNVLTGVPSLNSGAWTASAYTDYPNTYWIWSGTSTSIGTSSNYDIAVRCVVQ